jgi:hypothetical protein
MGMNTMPPPPHDCRQQQQQQQQQQQRQRLLLLDGKRWFSEEKKKSGFISRMRDAFTNRQERLLAEEFTAQCERMANQDEWTIADFQKDLAKTTSSWRAMIPGVGDSKEVETARESNKIALAIIETLGPNLCLGNMMNLSREDKLKIAIKSERSVTEINVFMNLCQHVDIMHKVLRQRKIEGKPIPKEQQALQSLIQTEGIRAMSNSQRKLIKAQMTKKSKKLFRS